MKKTKQLPEFIASKIVKDSEPTNGLANVKENEQFKDFKPYKLVINNPHQQPLEDSGYLPHSKNNILNKLIKHVEFINPVGVNMVNSKATNLPSDELYLNDNFVVWNSVKNNVKTTILIPLANVKSIMMMSAF